MRFGGFAKMLTDGHTDTRTDGRTDRPSYRDARTHIEMESNMCHSLVWNVPLLDIMSEGREKTRQIINKLMDIISKGREKARQIINKHQTMFFKHAR